MAFNTCLILGKLCTPDGSGVAGATVKAYSVRPFYASDGSLVVDYAIQTTTDSNGNWDLTLISTEGYPQAPGNAITLSLYYPSGVGGFSRREYSVSIPNTDSTTFFDLVPYTSL